MSLQSRIPADAAAALRLEDLPAFERRVIRLVRLRRAGPAGVAEAEATAGARACGWLDALLRLLSGETARPLRAAAPGARTALGDECVLARVVSLAAEGAEDEAALTCGLLAPPEAAREAARLAGALGRSLLAARDQSADGRAYLIAGRPVTPRGAGGR